jgi:Mannose-6-phosphate isomerase
MIVDGNEYEVKDGDAVLVPAGAAHNVINTGSEPCVFIQFILHRIIKMG